MEFKGIEEISRWPSLLEKLLYAIAFYIEDPTTYYNFCISSRITNKIANNDPIFVAYKRKQLTRFVLFDNDLIPVLPNGLVHGIINGYDFNRSLRFYQLGHYKYSISLFFKKTRMADMYLHKLFTKHLRIVSTNDCVRISRYNNSIKINSINHEIEANRCSFCKQYHSFYTEYRDHVYVIYRDCIKDIKKCYYYKQPVDDFIRSGGFSITPHEKKYSIMKSVIEYSKKISNKIK